ncbi:Endoribonuclease Dicer-like protein 1, partial [Frankliniella fusca]
DPASARLWLSLSGVYDQTPKKLLSHWCLCSCHFPAGRKGNPIEFVEEYDEDTLQFIVESPDAKSRRTDLLTPSTKAVVDALMLLPAAVGPPQLNEVTTTESSIGTGSSNIDSEPPQLNECPTTEQSIGTDSSNSISVKSEIILKARRRSMAKYSPSRQLWTMRNKQVVQETRQAFRQSLCFEDLGVDILPTENLDVTPHDENNNSASEENNIGGTCTQRTPSQKDQCDSCAVKSKDTCSVGTQCDMAFLSYSRFKLMSEEDFRFYIGITQDVFEILYTFLGGDKICSTLKYEFKRKTPRKKFFRRDMCAKDNLLLTLMRLRRGMPLSDLKLPFKLSISQISKIFYTWIRFMSLEFKKLQDVMFIPAKCQDRLKPVCFEPFKNLRVIIDCAEFKMQKLKHMQQNSNTFSDYKSYNSVKFLFGISCFGELSFMSEGYERSITDRKIVQESGFLDYLQPGDAVMADKGFDMEDLMDEYNVNLFIPDFTHGRTSVTAREVISSRIIAEARVHVERYISRVKEFRLIRFRIPNNSCLAVASDMVRVCAFLVNFQNPFIKLRDEEENL